MRIFLLSCVLSASAFLLNAAPRVNLALNRPVAVSSTDHAPTQGEFAVDGELETGWRARFFVDYDRTDVPEKTLPQWITVDLQGMCNVDKIRFFCEADASTPLYVTNRRLTIGHETYSSYPTVYRIEASTTGNAWTILDRARNAQGGWQEAKIDPAKPWRYIRVVIEECSTHLPVGINELEVWGECLAERPATSGWKERRKTKTASDTHLTPRSAYVSALDGGWEMTCNGWNGATEGAAISRAGLKTDGWYNATVPGTVVATLVEQEVFPDPAAGLNNLRIPEVLCRNSWWYRREFDRSALPGQGKDQRILLETGKINHHANFWVNGQLVGNVDYCFSKGSFDITPYLVDGRNAVAVEICPMALVGVPGDKGEEGEAWVNSRVISRSSPTYICSSGWDWMPSMRDRGIGMLEEVTLRAVKAVTIEDPYIRTDLHLPDTTAAYIYVDVPLRNASQTRQKVDVTAAFGAVTVKGGAVLEPGTMQTLHFSPESHPALRIRKPLLWWPNGYGAQNLYGVKITASVDGAVSDVYSCKTGVRKYTYNLPNSKSVRRGTHMIDPTEARYVRIYMNKALGERFGLFDFSVYDSNDVETDIAAWKKAYVSSNADDPESKPEHLTDVRGVSKWFSAGNSDEWTTVDLGENKKFDMVIAGWYARGLPESYRVEVSDDNKNWRTVVDGAGETPATQLEVSVNGVKVFCKGGNWGLEEVALRMPRERMENALRLHRDSKMNMIRSWMGNFFDPDFFECCDKYGVMVYSDLWGGMPDDKERYVEIARENIVRFRNHPCIALWCASNETYPAIPIERGIRRAVEELDSARLYLAHSSDDHVVGGNGTYFWVPVEHYYQTAHGFKTEIGLPTVPVYETMLRLCGTDQAWPIGDTWYYHDYSSRSGQAIGLYNAAFERMLGKAESMEDYCRKAQFVNYENTRAMFEAWNANLWDNGCSALLLWMSHPAWYSTVWQTYDYDFEVNGTWAGAKKGCESLHIQCSPLEGMVTASNTTSRTLAGARAEARIYDINGKQWGETQKSAVNVPASDKLHLFAVQKPADVPPLHFILLRLTDSRGKLLSENFYWQYSQPEDMQLLNTAGNATLKAHIGAPTTTDGRTKANVTLTNTGNVMAAMVRLSLCDADGERVLPSLYSDNYFWIVPGQSRTIEVECSAADLHGAKPVVAVSGYNVDRFEIN